MKLIKRITKIDKSFFKTGLSLPKLGKIIAPINIGNKYHKRHELMEFFFNQNGIDRFEWMNPPGKAYNNPVVWWGEDTLNRSGNSGYVATVVVYLYDPVKDKIAEARWVETYEGSDVLNFRIFHYSRYQRAYRTGYLDIETRFKGQKPYKILGLKGNESIKEVKRKFKRLIRQYHPDVNKSKEASEKTIQLLWAYNQILRRKL